MIIEQKAITFIIIVPNLLLKGSIIIIVENNLKNDYTKTAVQYNFHWKNFAFELQVIDKYYSSSSRIRFFEGSKLNCTLWYSSILCIIE